MGIPERQASIADSSRSGKFRSGVESRGRRFDGPSGYDQARGGEDSQGRRICKGEGGPRARARDNATTGKSSERRDSSGLLY